MSVPDIRNYVSLKTNERNKSKLDLTIYKYPNDLEAISLDKNDDLNDTKTTDESQVDQDSMVQDVSQDLDKEWDTYPQEQSFQFTMKAKCEMNLPDIAILINMLSSNELIDTRARYYTKW